MRNAEFEMKGAELGAELEILKTLDAAVSKRTARAAIDPIVARVHATLDRDPAPLEAWEPVPLEAYGSGLPATIRSSWVFILRAGTTSGTERHPNSHQRMMSYRNTGDLEVMVDGRWRSNVLVSDPAVPLERRWVSIPVNVWHRPVVPPGPDWVVVSFHTVPAKELIEERPDPGDAKLTRRRLYLAEQGNLLIPSAVVPKAFVECSERSGEPACRQKQ